MDIRTKLDDNMLHAIQGRLYAGEEFIQADVLLLGTRVTMLFTLSDSAEGVSGVLVNDTVTANSGIGDE